MSRRGRDRGVALGGFMAAGKTTIGRILAPTLGLPFVDLDARIEADSGRDIPSIFSAEGEGGFRAREAACLAAVLRGPPAVLSLGGGTLHSGDNRARLAAAGWTVVVLDLPWAEVRARLERDRGGRPLAADPSRLRALYEERRPGYLEAGVVVPVGSCSPAEAAARIEEVLP